MTPITKEEKGNLSDKDKEMMEVTEEAESEEEKKERERKESKVFSIKTSLDIAKDLAIKDKFGISDEVVNNLVEKIEDARSKGIDLSSIENLDDEIRKLQEEAPLISINTYLEKAKNSIDDKKEGGLLPKSWYFATIEKFNKYKDIISPEEAEKIQKELDELKLKLNLEE